jgi:hypothetical protein
MRRREFISLLGGAQAGKVYRVGVIFATTPVSEKTGPEPVQHAFRAFVHVLCALAMLKGRTSSGTPVGRGTVRAIW